MVDIEITLGNGRILRIETRGTVDEVRDVINGELGGQFVYFKAGDCDSTIINTKEIVTIDLKESCASHGVEGESTFTDDGWVCNECGKCVYQFKK